MRLRYKAWAKPELEANKFIFFDPVDKKGRWKEEFDNLNPIYLELGAGRGKFSAVSAEENPAINYIGVEMENKAFVYASRLYEERELKNIRGIAGRVEKLAEYFDDGEVDRIYINFCNPWPKNRQQKRRLTHPRQLAIYETILKAGGEIHFKTDDEGLFEDSIGYLEAENFEILEIERDLPAEYRGNIVTEYEKKWRDRGIKIKFLRARLSPRKNANF